jgi:hypothetical protein
MKAAAQTVSCATRPFSINAFEPVDVSEPHIAAVPEKKTVFAERDLIARPEAACRVHKTEINEIDKPRC